MSSYPVFAFCIIMGWKHTSNKEKYFSRLALFAYGTNADYGIGLMGGGVLVVTQSPAVCKLHPIAFIVRFIL